MVRVLNRGLGVIMVDTGDNKGGDKLWLQQRGQRTPVVEKSDEHR